MKRINTAFSIRTVFIYTVSYPPCSIGTDTADRFTLLFCKRIEEPLQYFLSIADTAPYDGVCIVVHDDGHILVPFLIACFVNSDVDKVFKAIRSFSFKFCIDSADYLTYGVPFNTYEFGYEFLGAEYTTPGYSVFKSRTKPRFVTSPRNICSYYTMFRAAYTRSFGDNICLRSAYVKATPLACSAAVVILGRFFPANSATVLTFSIRMCYNT